ncbi:MAG: single-stranded-DNA-specific exonuclease RecJ, partial [Candidatus Peribacteraceae bacterium]|nr:single-stranded-DNA-specific exonuclease RecJ [Candidatus Peribacteraceae bacterium]
MSICYARLPLTPLLSLTGKRWHVSSAEAVPSHAIVALLLKQRGLAENCAVPSSALLPDLPRAVERIRAACERKEQVGIFGDYDCDGITGVAQLVRFFERHGAMPYVILPHRVHDGYGLKPHIVERFAQQGITLLLTVDTGITAIREIEQARERGMDVIITDHHHLQAELPAAYAIIHPALAPHFPLPHPSGSGVAHLLVRALEENGQWEDCATDSALAMIGTIADLVELKGGNRALVCEGLAALNTLDPASPLGGLAQGIRAKDRPLTSTDIAFRLAPRINAAGRMEDPTIALTALLHGGAALSQLEELNVERQHSARTLLEETLTSLSLTAEPSVALPPLLSIAREHFPEGIIGLIAGKLTEQYGRPSLAAAISDGECTASLRSTRAYHITQGLERVSDLLTSFGGHAQAAGCTFKVQHLEELQRRLSEDIAARTTPADLLPALEIDAVLSPRDLSLSLCEQLRHLEPFGQGNPEPLFLLRNVHMEQPRRVGNEGAHLQARIAGHKTIGFRLGHLFEKTSDMLDIVCKIGIDTWNGRKAVQIVVEDIRA